MKAMLTTHLLLSPDDSCKLSVDNVGVEFTAHECGAFIIFDVALVNWAAQLDVLTEPLLLKVTWIYKCTNTMVLYSYQEQLSEFIKK